MRAIAIDEDNSFIFDQELTSSHYKFYMQHKEAFSRMWKDQGEAFWIRYVISFRSFTYKLEIIGAHDMIRKALVIRKAEEAFIMILKHLTGTKANNVYNFLEDVATVAQNRNLIGNITSSSHAQDPFYAISTRSSFRALFGDPHSKETLITMCDLLPIYMRIGGSLCNTLKVWLDAPVVDNNSFEWKPPVVWTDPDKMDGPNYFEDFLKQQWGEKLLDMLNLKSPDIQWWNKPSKNKHLEEKRKKHVVISKKEVEISVFVGVGNRGPSSPRESKMSDNLSWSSENGRNPLESMLGIMLSKAMWRLMSQYPMPTENDFRFHPHTQAVQSIWEEIFGPKFVYSILDKFRTIRKLLSQEFVSKLTELDSFKTKKMNKLKKKTLRELNESVEKKVSIFENRTTVASIAMKKSAENSTLKVQLVLTDPFHLLQLPWNLNLLQHWLDTMLHKILKFEHQMIPLYYFPMRNAGAVLMEPLSLAVQQAKVLTQGLILLLEELKFEEGNSELSWQKTGESRKLIRKYVIKLSPMMNFLDNQAYEILEVIQNYGWTEKEKAEGKCDKEEKVDRRYFEHETDNFAEGIEHSFIYNHRHFLYWLNTEEVPDINATSNFIPTVTQILKNFQIKVPEAGGESLSSSGSSPRKKTNSGIRKFTKVEETLIKQVNLTCTEYKKVQCHILETIQLLKADGFLNESIIKAFCKWLDSSFKQKGSGDGMSKLSDKTKKTITYLHHMGCLYMLSRSILHAREESDDKRKTLFSQLFHLSCEIVKLESMSKFSVAVHELVQQTPCPPQSYFASSHAEICNEAPQREKVIIPAEDTDVRSLASFKVMVNVLELCQQRDEAWLEKEVDYVDKPLSIKLKPIEQLTANSNWKVKNVAPPWLQELNRRHKFLIKKVVDECFRLCDSKNLQEKELRMYPQWHILQHRMYEEIGALQVVTEMDLQECVIKNLLLIQKRLSWLERSLQDWKNEHVKWSPPEVPQDSQVIFNKWIDTKLRVSATVMELQTLFAAYVPQMGATWPYRNTSIEILTEWMEFVDKLSQVDCDFWNTLPDLISTWTRVMEKSAVEYAEVMKNHILEVWKVPVTRNDLEPNTELKSVEHCQQIMAAVKKMHLVLSYVLHISDPRAYVEKHIPIIDELGKQIMVADCLVRQCTATKSGQKIPEENYPPWEFLQPEVLNRCNKIVKQMFRLVPPDAEFYKLPHWLVENDTWKTLITKFIEGKQAEVIGMLRLPSTAEIRKRNTTRPHAVTKKKMMVIYGTDKKPGEDEKKGKEEPKNDKGQKSTEEKKVDKTTKEADTKEMPAKNSSPVKKNGGKETGAIPKTKPNDAKNDQPEVPPSPPVEEKVVQKESGAIPKARAGQRICASCGKVEPQPKMYKKCQKCKEHKFEKPKFYCSKECQVKDWVESHRDDHQKMDNN